MSEKTYTPLEISGDIQSAINAGIALGMTSCDAEEKVFQGIPYLVRNKDSVVESLEDSLPNPRAKTGTHTSCEIGSFCDYVIRHGVPGTEIYIGTADPLLTAIIDGNEKEKAGWGKHRATFNLQQSVEFSAWYASAGKWMGQEAFALFLEENASDIVKPASAEMLEIALTLEGSKDVAFKSGLRLENGDVALAYEETTSAKAGAKGTLQIPITFDLELPIFVDGEKTPLTARLRYRISQGEVSFAYELIRVKRLLHESKKAAVEVAKKKLEKFPFFYGTPAR